MLCLKLELESLVLGFALLCSRLVKQFLLAAGRSFARRLLFLGNPLTLSLDGSLLSQPYAILLGALVCLATQAGQFGLLGLEQLAFL